MTTTDADPIAPLLAILDDRRRWGYLGRDHERVQVILRASDPLVPGSAKHLAAAASIFFGGEWELERSNGGSGQFGFKIFVVHKRRHKGIEIP
nr:hypothetical protein [Candidatus Sigynarchaeum springense]